MINENFGEFVEAWNVAQEMMAGGKQLSNPAMKMAFRMLAPYPIEIVTAAIYKHIESAKFAPQVSDIKEQLELHNKRISPAEAWAMMPKSEIESGVINDEMLQAWCLVSDLYESKQVFAAEKGFLAAYGRLCAESIAMGKSQKWTLSRGSNQAHLESTVKHAIKLGRLSNDYGMSVLNLLPKPATSGIVGLLSGKIDGEIGKRNAKEARKLIAILDAEIEKDKIESDARQKAFEKRRDSVIRTALDKLAESLSPSELKKVLDANLSSFEIPTGWVAE